MDDADTMPVLPPKEWIDALERARADVDAGRVVHLDLDELCSKIEADAAELERQEQSAPSAV
jgi:hypothetical protein